MSPKFSLIMQCYLGDYPTAASNREEKLIRAIDSALAQTFKDWELIIVADGCEKTFDIVQEKYSANENIDCRLITKQTTWGGAARNYGLKIAKGELVCYLDSDDVFGPNHLQIINDNIGSYDWAYFNDFVYNKINTTGAPANLEKNIERDCVIQVKNQFGTSNIVHKLSLGAMWSGIGYAQDDWALVEHLKKLSSNYGKIKTPEYIVCHIHQTGIDV